MEDLRSVFSKRFKVTIDYYQDGFTYYDDGHIGIVWGCSADDNRAYFLTFVDGVFNDEETEVA